MKIYFTAHAYNQFSKTGFSRGFKAVIKHVTNMLLPLRREISVAKQVWQKRSSTKWINTLHNAAPTKTALVIGNGPSVNIPQLRQFSGLTTFACNRFHLCYSQTKFRPDYTCVIDEQMCEDFGIEICAAAGGEVFIANPKIAVATQSHYLPTFSHKDFEFRKLIRSRYVHTGHSVIIAMIQLAFHMGYRNIYLYGVDHSFNRDIVVDRKTLKASGDGNHFIKNYRSGKQWYPPDLPDIERAFVMSEKFLKNQGGKLINLTEKTQLPGVPKGSSQRFINSKYARH